MTAHAPTVSRVLRAAGYTMSAAGSSHRREGIYVRRAVKGLIVCVHVVIDNRRDADELAGGIAAALVAAGYSVRTSTVGGRGLYPRLYVS